LDQYFIATELQLEQSVGSFLKVSLLAGIAAMALAVPSRLQAQESPYMVTYDHYLEEPGSLEVAYFSTLERSALAMTFTLGGWNWNME